MNPLDLLGGGGLSLSQSAAANSTGGTQGGTESSFSPTFYSPFAVGAGASATATGPTAANNTALWVVGIIAAAAALAALLKR